MIQQDDWYSLEKDHKDSRSWQEFQAMGLFHGYSLEIQAHTSVHNHQAQGFSSLSTCQALINNKIKW